MIHIIIQMISFLNWYSNIRLQYNVRYLNFIIVIKKYYEYDLREYYMPSLICVLVLFLKTI